MLGPGRSIGNGENWPDLRDILGVELKRLPYGLGMGRELIDKGGIKDESSVMNLINWEERSAIYRDGIVREKLRTGIFLLL